MSDNPKVGDVQFDRNGAWVVIGVTGRNRVSRVKHNSLAHRVSAQSDPKVAKSLDRNVDEFKTASESRPTTTG